MNADLWKYTDHVDEEDILFLQHDFITYKMAEQHYHINPKLVIKLARKSGAMFKIGKMVRIKREDFEAYLRSLYKP